MLNGVGERLVPPIPQPESTTPSSRRLLWHYRNNALCAWPVAAYEDDVFVRSMFGRRTILVNRSDDIRRVLVDNAANYGRTRPTIRIIGPILGSGLFLAEGEEWRHQRRATAPGFAPKSTSRFATQAAAAFTDALSGLDENDSSGIDLLGWFQELALDVAGRALFSLPMSTLGPHMRRLLDSYGRRFGQPDLLDFLLPLWLPNTRDLGRLWFKHRWFRLIDDLINERRAIAPGGERDLFDLLIEARHPETGAPFDAATLRGQVATFVVAGHETTAVALFWTARLLAQSPAWQDRVAEEAASLDLSPEGAAAALQKLNVTRAVVREAMRLYPPAFVIVRQARAADRLAGREVPAGAVIMIAPWVLHRHRRLWDDADAFDPRRLLPEAPPPDRFAYLPFGAGPRVCIGASLAMAEATLVIAGLVSRFRLQPADDFPVLPVAVVTTQPDRRARFRLTPR
ncbi:MAG: cytochrome P450 [Rhodospirillales bacterium]|nr:cytochrome P450 [Rhodospirillales bacterium]